MGYLGLFGDLRGLSGVIFTTSWNFLGNHDDLGQFGDLAWVIWGYLGIWRGLSGVIFPLPEIFWGIMMTITDLVTPPATRAVAPNRLVSSSKIFVHVFVFVGEKLKP